MQEILFGIEVKIQKVCYKSYLKNTQHQMLYMVKKIMDKNYSLKNIMLIILLLFPHSSWGEDKLDALLDGLHQDAHEGNFDAYFARYNSTAVFLGTVTFPLSPLRTVAPACMTVDAFLNTSIKSPPL